MFFDLNMRKKSEFIAKVVYILVGKLVWNFFLFCKTINPNINLQCSRLQKKLRRQQNEKY